MKQSARWSLASKQDKNPLISNLHANYGAGYLWAMKDIATSDQIQKITGIDIIKFEEEIKRAQDISVKKAIHSCPQYTTQNGFLFNIAGS